MEKNRIKEAEIDQVLHEHYSFNVDKGQEPLRIDKFLMNRICLLYTSPSPRD